MLVLLKEDGAYWVKHLDKARKNSQMLANQMKEFFTEQQRKLEVMILKASSEASEAPKQRF